MAVEARDPEIKNAFKREVGGDNWRRRRRIMFLALGFIALNVQYLVVFAPDDALRQNLGIALVTAGVGIIGSYVFGAVWDDSNKRSTLQEAVHREEAEVEAG